MEEIQHYEIESDRLRFRRLRADDFGLVAPILQDVQTMYAWEHAFSYEEVCDWIADMLHRYREDGCGYFAALSRQTGALVALAGPLVEQLQERAEIGIGYIVRRELWGQGYGVECARACIRYAFGVLGAVRVVANNLPSLRVAAQCGMQAVGQISKQYRGKDMPHIVCALDQPLTQGQATAEDSADA